LTNKFKSEICEVNKGSCPFILPSLKEEIVLARPQTFMNLSGEALIAIKNFYKIENKDILIVVDDLDLPLGKIRLREKGSSGGHNGLKSIIQHLGTKEFARMRLGIGVALSKEHTVKKVLSSFSNEEKEIVEDVIERALESLQVYLEEGIEMAISKLRNSPKSP